MSSIFDFFEVNRKKFWTLIALDIVKGLDNNFYIVDINGLIGLRPIIQFEKEFNKRLYEIIGDKFSSDDDNVALNLNGSSKDFNNNLSPLPSFK